MRLISRSNYLEWLVRQKDRQIIKVVSGVRRCGKSTLFALYQDYLLGRVDKIAIGDGESLAIAVLPTLRH